MSLSASIRRGIRRLIFGHDSGMGSTAKMLMNVVVIMRYTTVTQPQTATTSWVLSYAHANQATPVPALNVRILMNASRPHAVTEVPHAATLWGPLLAYAMMAFSVMGFFALTL